MNHPSAPTNPDRQLLLRGVVVVATFAGIAIAVRTVAPFSVDEIRQLAGTIGWAGFLAYTAYSLLVFAVLGAAWLIVIGERWAVLPVFAWARMLREAASDLLPFSQIGGIVIGADSLIARGFSAPSVYASMTADLTSEMASQAFFTTFAIVSITTTSRASIDSLPQSAILAGLAVIALLTVAAGSAPAWIPRIAPVLLARVAPASLANVNEVVDRLRGMYRHHGRMFGSVVLNTCAWTMSAAGAWIVVRCMGSDVPLPRILSLEAFIFALRSVAFLVPGGIGVQETGYALLAPLFGLPIDQAIVLALTKRCKDLAIGLPTLIVWQLVEVRKLSRLLGRRKAATSPARNAR